MLNIRRHACSYSGNLPRKSDPYPWSITQTHECVHFRYNPPAMIYSSSGTLLSGAAACEYPGLAKPPECLSTIWVVCPILSVRFWFSIWSQTTRMAAVHPLLYCVFVVFTIDWKATLRSWRLLPAGIYFSFIITTKPWLNQLCSYMSFICNTSLPIP